MKKNKLVYGIISIMLAVVLGFCLYSCKPDDKIDGSTWKGTMTWADLEGEDDEDGSVTLTVTFTSEVSGNWSGISIEQDGKIEDSESGTFQCNWSGDNQGTVIIRREKGKETLRGHFVIKDKRMQLTDVYDDAEMEGIVFVLNRQ